MRQLLTVAGICTALTLSLPAPALAAPDAGVRKADAKAPAAKTDAGAKPDAGAKAPPKPPEDVKGALQIARDAYEAAKAGRWWLLAALVVTLLMFLLKFIGIKAGFWPKLGRWRYVIPPVLSLTAALLAAFQGGVTFDAALLVFTSSYATSSLQELWEHGILGNPRASG